MLDIEISRPLKSDARLQPKWRSDDIIGSVSSFVSIRKALCCWSRMIGRFWMNCTVPKSSRFLRPGFILQKGGVGLSTCQWSHCERLLSLCVAVGTRRGESCATMFQGLPCLALQLSSHVDHAISIYVCPSMSFLKWCWTEAGDCCVGFPMFDLLRICKDWEKDRKIRLANLQKEMEKLQRTIAHDEDYVARLGTHFHGASGFRVVFCNKSPLGKGKRYASQVKCRCSGWFPKSRVYDGWRISAACNPSQPWLLTAHLLGRFGAKASHAAQALLQHM